MADRPRVGLRECKEETAGTKTTDPISVGGAPLPPATRDINSANLVLADPTIGLSLRLCYETLATGITAPKVADLTIGLQDRRFRRHH